MRLNKYIAQCGIESRRKADDSIKKGFVTVNGRVENDPSYIVNKSDKVLFNGKIAKLNSNYSYIMLHKPKGCVSTVTDDRGRKTVMDFLPATNKRMYPIGRLDYDTEGLLIFTNDGDIANKLMHPKFNIEKTYQVAIEGKLSTDIVSRLLEGVQLEDGVVVPTAVKLIFSDEKISKISISVTEGRNRIIRRTMEALGYNVVFLKRISIGEVRLGGLGRGKSRYLNEKEINYLRRITVE